MSGNKYVFCYMYTLNISYKPPLYKLRFFGNYFIDIHKKWQIVIKHQHLQILTGKTCVPCYGYSGGTQGLILKFWLENPVHIMKFDTTHFYRIVTSIIKVKIINTTRMSIEELGRAV